jgi:hypothetical protein
MDFSVTKLSLSWWNIFICQTMFNLQRVMQEFFCGKPGQFTESLLPYKRDSHRKVVTAELEVVGRWSGGASGSSPGEMLA